jgi:hypothetical protein
MSSQLCAGRDRSYRSLWVDSRRRQTIQGAKCVNEGCRRFCTFLWRSYLCVLGSHEMDTDSWSRAHTVARAHRRARADWRRIGYITLVEYGVIRKPNPKPNPIQPNRILTSWSGALSWYANAPGHLGRGIRPLGYARSRTNQTSRRMLDIVDYDHICHPGLHGVRAPVERGWRFSVTYMRE